jgi:anti-sigma regulatory factor (Ser/Thr protein kinase)
VNRRSVHVVLPFRAEAVREARSIVRHYGGELSTEIVEDAELLASEVVTNAVRHGGPVIEFAVAVDAASLTVRVSDGSSRLPNLRDDSALDEPSGRGLKMVDQVATEWGVELVAGDGKTVWFRLNARYEQSRETLVDENEIGVEGANAWN